MWAAIVSALGLTTAAGISQGVNAWSTMSNIEAQYALQQINQQWMQYMSSTHYQRAAQDLKLAGLNPALAVTGTTGTYQAPTQKTSDNYQLGTAKLLVMKKLHDQKYGKK